MVKDTYTWQTKYGYNNKIKMDIQKQDKKL